MSDSSETIAVAQAQTSAQTSSDDTIIDTVIKQEEAELDEDEDLKPPKTLVTAAIDTTSSSCLLSIKNQDENTDQKAIIHIKEEQSLVLATKKIDVKSNAADPLADDNEKENDLKQDISTNGENIGQEEIIDGFSFLTFEYESDLKVR